MTTAHQPQPPIIRAHRLAKLVPAVLATLRTPAATVGFGTAAGYMARLPMRIRHTRPQPVRQPSGIQDWRNPHEQPAGIP